MAKGSKYTQAMVEVMQAHAPLDLQKATALSESPLFQEAGVTPRGIVAKARTLGLEYIKVERKAKDGSVVIRKDALVAEIEALTGASGLDTLAKADKAALRNLLTALAG